MLGSAVVRVGPGTDSDADESAACGEGRDVISVPAGVRVLVATKPVDFRRGADSLAALAKEELQRDPFLCVGRDYVAASSREALFRGSALSHRHIIICSRAVAAPCLLT